MSGHSKWSQIKHKKGIADAKKGKIFGKIAQAISVAARGNSDPTTNLRLKGEVERARAANMPSENIERAIRRVADKDAAELKDIRVAFIGPGGAGILVHAITDNSNRTINELKQLASKADIRMAEPNAVAWMFNPENPVKVPVPSPEDRQRLEAFLGALDDHDDVQDVDTSADL
jgi:YebC/PmpR family DNA-binding regulatory protein